MKGSFFRAFILFLCSFNFALASPLCVTLNSTNPIPPYADWSTAATNIQDAIDFANPGDLILVSNGLYKTGGRVVFGSLTNRVAVYKGVTVESVNGPSLTVIQGNSVLGSNAVRCVMMTNGSVLVGFTLQNGGTLNSGDYFQEQSGAGVWTTNNSTAIYSGTAIISNCVIVGNIANGAGGGAYWGNLYNCVIVQNRGYTGGGVNYSSVANSLIESNVAAAYGGGAFSAPSLSNCKIIQNKAPFGGGAAFSSLYGCLVLSNTASQLAGGAYSSMDLVNCTIIGNTSYQGSAGIEGGAGLLVESSIVYYNTLTNGTQANYDIGSFLNSCTTPMPLSNINCITNEPGFLDAAHGDFHLASNSPCINSGNNQSVFTPADLDGNLRLVDGLVDIGAYEYQTADFRVPYYFVQQYGITTNGLIDSDGDGLNNWQEAIAGTNPTNAVSAVKLLTISNSASGITISWPHAAFRTYFVQRSCDLAVRPAFTNITGGMLDFLSGTSTFQDRTATNAGPYFYRICVQYVPF